MVLSGSSRMYLLVVLFEGTAVVWALWQIWQLRPGRTDKPSSPQDGLASPGAPSDE